MNKLLIVSCLVLLGAACGDSQPPGGDVSLCSADSECTEACQAWTGRVSQQRGGAEVDLRDSYCLANLCYCAYEVGAQCFWGHAVNERSVSCPPDRAYINDLFGRTDGGS